MNALFDACVPVLLRYLERLEGLLAQAERQGGDALLTASLAPDMLPLAAQAEVAANFSLRASYPLAGLPVPEYGIFPATYAGLAQRIARARGLLQALQPRDFGRSDAPIEDRAGQARIALPPQAYLSEYALPNFFFHLSTAYAILRSRGIAVGKGDFDGFHLYPKGTT